jgi:hypothetical protein
MSFLSRDGDKAVFKGQLPLTESGRHGFSIRITPSHPDLFDRPEPGYVAWSQR